MGAANDAKPALDDPVLARVRELAADEHHFLNQGRSLEAKGQIADAVELYERALAINPRMASAHANLVGAYGRLGILKAEAHYEAALSIDPGIEELHNNWGVLQASKRDAEAAAAAFRRALEVNPQSAKAHANLGVALTELGQGDEAARHFRQAVASDPTNRPARMNLGAMALARIGRQKQQGTLKPRWPGKMTGASRSSDIHSLTPTPAWAARETPADPWAEALRLAEASGLVELAARIRQDSNRGRARLPSQSPNRDPEFLPTVHGVEPTPDGACHRRLRSVLLARASLPLRPPGLGYLIARRGLWRARASGPGTPDARHWCIRSSGLNSIQSPEPATGASTGTVSERNRPDPSIKPSSRACRCSSAPMRVSSPSNRADTARMAAIAMPPTVSTNPASETPTASMPINSALTTRSIAALAEYSGSSLA